MMAQSYIDNKTAERFNLLFQCDDGKDVETQFRDMENRLIKSATLEAESCGSTLEDARKELRLKIKTELYGAK